MRSDLNECTYEKVEHKVCTISRISKDQIEARGKWGHKICYFLIEIDESQDDCHKGEFDKWLGRRDY